jgi:hypothetical protein
MGTAEEEQFNKSWGWYQSIYAIARGNLAEFERVTRLPSLSLFKLLSI